LVAKHVSSGLGLPEEGVVPGINLSDVDHAEDVELIASDLRESLRISEELQVSWKTDAEALSEWRERVEAAGIFVFALPMAVAECRGASIWETEGPPAILLNSSDGTTAQLFTLMHEYAHLMISQRRGAINLCDPSRRARNREERLANRLAAAVLLPRSLILSRVPDPVPANSYSDWPSKDRRRLRDSLNVSYAAIGIRLKELGIVGEAGAQTFWRKPSSFVPRGVSRPAWQRYRRYLGSHATRLAKRAVDSETMTAAEVARLLDLKVSDVETMLD
jgi:Zn-dependent peptidase ImmA (M78 family)